MLKIIIKNQSHSGGFTLIEVLISAVLIVLLGGAFVALQYAYRQNQVTVWQNYENVDEANRAITMIEKELRNIHESANGSYPLVTASDQEIIFFSDVNFDEKIERVRYTHTNTQLVKGIIDPVGIPATYPTANEKTMVVNENIRNGTTPVFYYYNGDWPIDTTNNPLAAASRIANTKLVRVNLRVNIKNDTRTDYVLDSFILLRSIKES